MEIRVDNLTDQDVWNDWNYYYILNSGGVVSNNNIMSGGNVQAVSNNTVIGNTIHSAGIIHIQGGYAICNVVSNGGTLTIELNTVASANIIADGGVLNVGYGGAVVGNYIQKGGILSVGTENATVSNNTVLDGGVITVNNDATVNNNTISANGIINLANGGAASGNMIAFGGKINIFYRGVAIKNTVYPGASITVNDGGVASNNTIQNGGVIEVFSGGMALSNIVSTGGNLIVSAGGSAVWNSLLGGTLTADNAYLANNIINNGGSISAFGGGIAQDTTINSGGNFYLGSNGNALRTTIESGATLSANYATVTSVTINSGGVLDAGFGDIGTGEETSGRFITKVNNASVNAGGTLNISRGIAVGNIVNGGTVDVYEFGSLKGTTAIDGKINLLGATGIVEGVSVGNGAVLNVSEGLAVGNHVLSGGNVNAVGGVVSGTTISNGADLNVSVGATVANNTILSGGNLNISAGAIASDNNIAFGGTITVSSGGLALNNHLSSGANLILQSGGSAFGNTLQSGANFIVDQGALASAGTIGSGGIMSITNGAKLQGITIQSGGSAVLEKGAQLDGTIILEGGGYLAITDSNGGTVRFTDTTTPLYLLRDGIVTGDLETGLVVSGTGDITTVIDGFSGKTPGDSDKITLANVKADEVKEVTYLDADHVKFSLKNGTYITLNVIGVQNLGYALGSDANGAVTYEVCFLTGTLISMMDGVRAVENIQVGDKVKTYNPQTKKTSQREVIWVGKKTAYARQMGLDDEAGYPVRILKDAIADNVPNKDLLVTSEHCLFFNGHLTPVRMLVNGRSIYYDRSLTTYDYYHIETEQHSVIMADGMLTESYLDTGNRHSFMPEQNIVSIKGKSWNQDAAAPLVVEQAVVEPLYRQIEERACVMGCEYKVDPIQVTTDADLRLITDKGQMIGNDLVSQDGKIVFIIPAHTKFVRIVSRVGRPSTRIGPFVDDRRYLGLLIGDMQVFCHNDIKTFNIHTQTDVLDGWDVLESELCRWTKGDALLPLDQLGDFDTPIYLSIKILQGAPYILEDRKDEDQKQFA